MLSRRELDAAIAECENASTSYQNCQKLATLYTVYDHLYTQKNTSEETIIGDYGDSEFLMSVRSKRAEDIWIIIDELMDALKVTNPRLYDGVMRKIAE